MPFSPLSPVKFFQQKKTCLDTLGLLLVSSFCLVNRWHTMPCKPYLSYFIIFYHRYGNMVARFIKQYQARSLCTEAKCRPCCPANNFLGSAFGTPSPPPPHAPACVLRLTGHGLRCLQRFYDQNSLCTTLFDSEAAFCRLSVESLDLSTVFRVVLICCPCCLPVPFVEVGVERERIQRCWCSLPTISCR